MSVLCKTYGASKLLVSSQLLEKLFVSCLVKRNFSADHVLGSHHLNTCRYYSKEPYNFEDAKRSIKLLTKEERELIALEIEKYQNEEDKLEETGTASITNSQAKSLFFINCVPFIGFGFFDNFIMILAGEYIDYKLGLMFGISTMAAAALGNLISDCCGVQLSIYVEAWCVKFGLHAPDLTKKQSELRKTRWINASGKIIGITIGCLIGMLPLLFIKEDDDQKKETDK